MNINPQSALTITAHGKWILAGEHAVLRGHPEIIFPIKTKQLNLQYEPSSEEIRAEFSGDYGDEIQFLFWSALERAIEILDIQHSTLTGKVFIENNIPVGAGMGASAALCVAIGRLLRHFHSFPEANLLEFCRQLENLFHGESSGADIAVAIAGEGILFSRSGAMHPITQTWKPQWYLSHSDKPSITSRCIKKVKQLWQQNPEDAEAIDQAMAAAVQTAEVALKMEPKSGLLKLTDAIHQAYHCFKRWQLCDGIVDAHIQQLLSAGALAAKPTGAGDGGYVLSLWDQQPSEMEFELLKV